MTQLAPDPAELVIQRAYLRNFTVNVLDGAFFGLGLSFTSLVTVLPLFVSHLTPSPLVIGLIPLVWNMGWLLPQLFTANYVQSLARKKPMVLVMSFTERLPYLLMAGIALGLPLVGPGLGLVGFFLAFGWTCLGGGLTATAWQEMIAKIMPPRRRGTFFGTQNFMAGLLSSAGAVIAGRVLEVYPYPANFAVCFALTFVAMMVSFAFLAMTVEPPVPASHARLSQREYWRQLPTVLRENPNFARFLLTRAVAWLGTMGTGFLTVYAVNRLGATPGELGLFTAASMIAQTGANLVLGLWGDRTGHKRVLEFAGLCSVGAMASAWLAGTPAWFYLAYALVGVATAGNIVSGLSIVLEFGPPAQRPTYIGLTNTLLAPFAGMAPLFGGWLAGVAGYPAMFALAALLSLLGFGLLGFTVREPRRLHPVTAAHD
jgi:MFS family permease